MARGDHTSIFICRFPRILLCSLHINFIMFCRCWTTNESPWLLWLLQAPVCFTIILNFCLFLRIARVLLNRVIKPEVQPASVSQQHTYKWENSHFTPSTAHRLLIIHSYNSMLIWVWFVYREWFRASLILIPLLASHYVVLLAMNLLSNLLPPVVEIVWFYIDALFTSFQVRFRKTAVNFPPSASSHIALCVCNVIRTSG